MRSLALAGLASALLTTTTIAITLQERSESTPKVFQADIQRRQVTNPLVRDRLRRRQTKTVEQGLDNQETLYYANATLGTPAQFVRLHIDTGSSDLWVNTPTSEICTYRGQGLCEYAGTYSPNASSTYRYVNSIFTIQYADGSGATGDYVTDNFEIGGATLESQQFAVGYASQSTEGILGIGYPANEAILSVRGQRTYPNVPQKMLNQGLINVNAYSLWLNDLDASTGSILFGGVNTEKFVGSLSTLPIIQNSGRYTAFYIALTGLGTDGNPGSINSSISTAVLLDSGSSLTYLPDNLASAVFTELGVTYDTAQGAAFIDCSRGLDNRTLEFTFSEPTISVSMSELVITIGYRGDEEICILGISPTGGSTPVLGDTFLRSAYVVYDISNNQIALAQTNFNSTTDRVLEITNGTATESGIPDATGVANAVTSVANSVSGNSGARNGLGSVSSVAAAPTAMPMGYMGGVGVAAAAVGAAILAL